MAIRVLIVDDSSFICKLIQGVLEEGSGFKVVGTASNGKQAIQLAIRLKPDIITMDVEMPVMDGISAVKKIMAVCPTPILMFSASTHTGAKSALDALNAGAIDFLPKQLDQIDDDMDKAKRQLRSRVRIVALQAKKNRSNVIEAESDSIPQEIEITEQVKITSAPMGRQAVRKKVELLVIAASTGGPVAIQRVLSQLSSDCSFPILIIQHMPDKFTKSFADRLNKICKVNVKEAKNGDVLTPGTALIGPGGMQMEVKDRGNHKIVTIREKQLREIYSPSIDLTLSSVAKVFTANVLTVVLTGMGADGKEGAKKLKKKGFSVWAQDEASSTIYGMPKAIIEANLADFVYSLDDLANEFKTMS